MQNENTDVLIIGAGPTGLALSIALLQAGVDHILIDKLATGQNTSRAGVIHAQTLESLTGLGVAQRLIEMGLKLNKFTIRDRDRALLGLDFSNLPSRFPYLLMLPQNITEQVFADRIGALGGSINRGVMANSITQDAYGVRVVVTENGQEKTIQARYVVGADGMHSLVRKTTGIEFEGAAYDGSFVLADVHLDWLMGPQEVSLFFSPAGLVVVAPLPDGSYRVVATMDDAPEQPGVADVQSLIDARGPTAERAKVLDVTWSSRFRLHHRLANSYRSGRLLLMGDAAHVHSPAGGQGMNTGIVDAVVLGEILADVVKGIRSEADLNLYETLRRPAAAQVLGLAGTMTGMATMRHPLKRFLRNAVMFLANLNPFVKRRMEMQLSGLSRAALDKVPAATQLRRGVTLVGRENGAARMIGMP